MFVPLGKIVVVSGGTPVRITSNLSDPSAVLKVHSLVIQWVSSNSDDMYVSLSSVDNRATLSECLGILNSSTPVWGAGIAYEVNGINAADLYLDAASDGDAAIVSAVVS